MINKIRNEILQEAKPLVIKYGWNENLFKQISLKSKYSYEEISILFSNNYMKLLNLYLDEINKKMTFDSKNIDFLRLKVHQRIRKLIILRLKIMVKEKKIIKETLTHLLLPNNYKFSLRNIYNTVDQIWFLSGDTSTDFNFYSKRVILASVYISVIIHFINNKNFDDTLIVLDTQLKRVAKIPKIKNKVSDFLQLPSQIFNLRKKLFFLKQ